MTKDCPICAKNLSKRIKDSLNRWIAYQIEDWEELHKFNKHFAEFLDKEKA